MKISIAVGVVLFNPQRSDLERFVKSFQVTVGEAESVCSARLYVINNGHAVGDDWLNGVSKAVVLENANNLGFARGMNEILKSAFADGVDAVLCANPDGAFHHQSINNMVRMNRVEPNTLLEARQFPEEHPKIYNSETLDTPWASGCCLFMPGAVYDVIGGFDPGFFMYMEDVDLSWRARLAGFRVKVCPDAFFYHPVLNRKHDSTRLKYMLLSGRYLGFKWGSPRFLRRCERLLEKHFGLSARDLPVLSSPADVRMTTPEASRVVCFDREFSFAEVRW